MKKNMSSNINKKYAERCAFLLQIKREELVCITIKTPRFNFFYDNFVFKKERWKIKC